MAAEEPCARIDQDNHGRMEEEATADVGEEKGDECHQDSKSTTEELPEMLEVIDMIEGAATDVDELCTVLRKLGLRIRASPDDRDLFTDFDGTAQICRALAGPPHHWQGEAMLSFCKIMPDVCRTSTLNRGALREEGFVVAVVKLLHTATMSQEQAPCLAAATALAALCAASDGNKRAAAQITPGELEGGAIPLLLNAIELFPSSVALQAEAVAALRSLLTDDDPRKADCMPAAVENREYAVNSFFNQIRDSVGKSLATSGTSDRVHTKLHEQALLLLRELARGEDKIQELAIDAKFLKTSQAFVETAEDPRIIRAGLSVLRAFAFNEEVREELALLSNGAEHCLGAVRKHIATPTVCEQGFGLFVNLTIRKSPIAAKLNAEGCNIMALGEQVLSEHPNRPDVGRSVINALRNVASQDESAATEARESSLFADLRKLVLEHQADARWQATVDITRQFLREFRADEGVQKAPQYNKFY